MPMNFAMLGKCVYLYTGTNIGLVLKYLVAPCYIEFLL